MFYYFDALSTFDTVHKLEYFLGPYILILSFCYIWFRLLTEYDELSYCWIIMVKNMEKSLPIKPQNMLFQAIDEFSINSGLGRLTKALPLLFAFFYLAMLLFIFTS